MSSRTPSASARGTKSPTEAEIVHRSFKINRVEPHPKRKVIIIYGELNVSIIGIGAMTRHDSIAEDTREFRKVIRLDSLNESSNPTELVNEILTECPYIVEQEVIDLLYTTIEYLQRRNYDANGIVVNGRGRSAGGFSQYEGDAEEEEDDDEEFSSSRSAIPTIFDDEDMTSAIDTGDSKEISMDELESYIELLYESLQEKAKGAYCISKLVTTSENLIIVFNHESATNALFRTLREDYKKSMDLTTNILRVCEQFAEFTDFHQHLLSHKLSSLIFEIIEYELDVYEQWKHEILSRQIELSNSMANNTQQKRIGSGKGDDGINQNLSQMSTKQIKAKLQLDKIQLRFDELKTKQDNLLLVALKILKYLRVTIPVEELYKKDLVKLLMTCLDRKHSSLLTVCIDFLAILSVYQECKNQMLKAGVIDTVQPYLVTSAQAIGDYMSTNRAAGGGGHNYHEYEIQMKQKMYAMNNSLIVLLYNLSFDTKSRLKLVKYGILQRAAQLFETADATLQQKCLLLLYNFSMDRKSRPKFAATNVVQKILKEIECTTDENPMNLYFIAILLNLATSKRCSQLMFKNHGLPLLIGWAFRTENHLTMKIIRKLAEHDQAILGPGSVQVKNEFVHYISDIANAICNASSTEFIIECVGTLGNLNIPELDFKKLLQECHLHGWIKNMLSTPLPERSHLRKVGEPRAIEESLFIEIAIFLSTCVEDVECARFILQDDLTTSLLRLCDISLKIDLDLQIQVLYIFYKMCHHKELLRSIVSSKIPDCMIKLLQHEYNRLRELAEAILDLIGEYNEEWCMKVKQEKFTAYNHHWLEMVSRSPDSEQDPTRGKPLQLKRPSSAMRRAPSAAGYNPEQQQAGSRQSSSRLSGRSAVGTATMKDSPSNTPSIRSETTTSDEEEDSGDDDIDFEEDDEQVSKQKWQQQQQNRAGGGGGGVTQFQSTGGNSVLNDSLETKNIFERFKHQFQQERDAQERNEYYSDPENELYNDDDEDVVEGLGLVTRHVNGGQQQSNSSESDVVLSGSKINE